MPAMTTAALLALSMLVQPAAQKAPAKKAAPPKAPAAAAATTDLPVNVTYKGKGTVDATHRILLFTFSDPNISASSQPIDKRIATKNGETVTFANVTGPVYVVAVYDEKGGYDGTGGPPPAGTPWNLYRKVAKGEATAVKPGAAVKFSFDDTQRWK